MTLNICRHNMFNQSLIHSFSAFYIKMRSSFCETFKIEELPDNASGTEANINVHSNQR